VSHLSFPPYFQRETVEMRPHPGEDIRTNTHKEHQKEMLVEGKYSLSKSGGVECGARFKSELTVYFKREKERGRDRWC
jgi:hypothetical protein